MRRSRGLGRWALLILLTALVAALLAPGTGAAAPDCTIVTRSGPGSMTGADPRALAYSPDGTRLYVAGVTGTQQGELNTLDAATGVIVRRQPLTFAPRTMTVDPSSGRLLVGGDRQGNAGQVGVYVIAESDGTVGTPVDHGRSVLHALAPPAGGAFYALVSQGGGETTLEALDTDGQVLRTVSFFVPSPSLAYDPSTAELLVGTSDAQNRIRRYAASDFTPGATSAASAAGGVTAIATAPSLGRAYAIRGTRFQVLDLTTLAVVADRDLGGTGSELAVDVAAGVAYVQAPFARLSRFDASSGVPLTQLIWGPDAGGLDVRAGGGVLAVGSRAEVAVIRTGSCVTGDADDPAVQIAGVAQDEEVALFEARTVAATCIDDGSGLAALPTTNFTTRCRVEQAASDPQGPGAMLDTDSPGSKSVTVTARDEAGNETTVTRDYTVVAPPDTTAPAIGITRPAEPLNWPDTGPEIARYTIEQVLTAEFECIEDRFGSGLAECSATVDGAPIAVGDPLPTDVAGIHDFTVRARDIAGNASSLSQDYEVLAGNLSLPDVFNRILTTDPGGLGASARVPVQTQVNVPRVRGPVAIVPVAAPASAPAGSSPLPGAPGIRISMQRMSLSTDLRIDAALLPADTARVRIALRGAIVPACDALGTPPVPDPCEQRRVIEGDGDLTIRVLGYAGDDGAPLTPSDTVWSVVLLSPGSVIAADVTGPGTVETGQDATTGTPLQTAVGIPEGVAGNVSVLPATNGVTPPTGYALLAGAPVLQIDAPAATASSPLVLTFRIDASLLGASPAATLASITPLRDGVAIADCTGPTATPDPCVASRALIAGGDGEVVVMTSHASRWAIARRTERFTFTGFFDRDAPPKFNSERAGKVVALDFALGGDKGLPVFAAGSPSTRPIDCRNGAPTGASAPAVAGPGGLSYNARKGRYSYPWATDRAWGGTCRELTMTFREGTAASIRFKLTG